MKSCEDELVSLTLSTESPFKAIQGACAVVYQAVCAEAIRLIFSLYALSQSGVAELVDELHRCREFNTENVHSSWVISEIAAPPCLAEIPSLFERTPSHKSAPLIPQIHEKRDQSHLPTPIEARRCITNASIYGLLTAAHLLRCSTWTAASLVPSPLVEGHSSPTLASQLLADARAAEELRTREPAWCATALVQLTEWLLPSLKPNNSPSQALSLPSRALSIEDAELTLSGLEDTAVPSSPLGSIANDVLHGVPMTPVRQRKCFVVDTFPRYLAFLTGRDVHRQCTTPWPSEPPRAANTPEKGCVHRWLLDDLPRWCAQVALNELSETWYHTNLLRSALGRWRARRGIRVVAHLSSAVDSASEAELRPSAWTAQLLTPQTDSRVVSRVRLGKEVDKAQPFSPRPSGASTAAPESHFLSTQTTALMPPSGEGGSALSEVQPTECFKEVLTNNASMISLETEPLSSIQTQDPPSASAPSVTLFTPPYSEDIPANVSTTYKLEDVLRGGVTLQTSPQPGIDGNKKTDNVNEACTEKPQHCKRKDPPRQKSKDAVEHSLGITPVVASPLKRGPPVDPSSDTSSDNLSQISTDLLGYADAQLAELLDALVQRRRYVFTQRLFFYWRDRRLYELLATRFLKVQRGEATMAHCWAQWRHRRAAILQRKKEAIDLARCDAYTEKKAIQYFRTILQRWKMAALVRCFRISTLGYRAFRAWECKARFLQGQRVTQQQLVGGRRVKWQVWTQWRQRRRESIADRFHARKHATATLLLMKDVCFRRKLVRLFTVRFNTAIVKRALQRWTSRCTLATRLRSFLETKQQQRTLLWHAWSAWRSRWLGQQTRREDEAKIRAFRVARLAAICFVQWSQRWQRETYIRACVSRQTRRHVLRPAFLHWQQKMQLCLILRQGQEELALKISEQLQGRRVLHTWHRKAVQNAERRQKLSHARMEAEAMHRLRFNRLARTFYHWRTQSFVIRWYNVDRRRPLPAAATTQSTAAVGHLRGNRTTLGLTEITGMEAHSKNAPEEENTENCTIPVSLAPLPQPPRSATPSPASPSRSQESRRKHVRPASTHSIRSPKKNPARGSGITAAHRSVLTPGTSAHVSPQAASYDDTHRNNRVPSKAATHQSSCFSHSTQHIVPFRKQSVALQRRLLAAQRDRQLFFCFPRSAVGATRPRLGMPLPTRPVHRDSTYFTTPAPRRIAIPPNDTVEQHCSHKRCDDDPENWTRWQTPTLTPPLTTCETEDTPRLHRSVPALHHTAALVESPHPSPLPQRYLPSGAPPRKNGDYATLAFCSSPVTPDHPLLGQMEQLLRRIRTIENEHSATAAAFV